MKVVYGVQWIEVDFGQRDEGYALFLDKEECISSTKKASEEGLIRRVGYLGPVRSLCFVEIPFDSLESEHQEKLKEKGFCHTSNRWSPKFKGKRTLI